MEILLVLLLSIPPLIKADCGCEDEWNEAEREREIDRDRLGCRSCLQQIVPSEQACPEKGYECNEQWLFVANVLKPDDYKCSEAKCASKSKLAVDKNITTSKLRCNNSQWMVNGEVPGSVVCAKPCGRGVCKNQFPGSLTNFVHLKVHDVSEVNPCAIGNCDPPGILTVLKENGKADYVLTDQNSVKCTGDGLWKVEDGRTYKYVMCFNSPCDSTKCPKGVPGLESDEFDELSVEDNGLECATATCPGGTSYVKLDKAGTVIDTLTTDGLTCTPSASWKDKGGLEHEFVMCQKAETPCRELNQDVSVCEEDAATDQTCRTPDSSGPFKIECPGTHPTYFLSAPYPATMDEILIAIELKCDNGKWMVRQNSGSSWEDMDDIVKTITTVSCTDL